MVGIYLALGIQSWFQTQGRFHKGALCLAQAHSVLSLLTFRTGQLWWALLGHCRMFSTIPASYSLHGSSSPQCGNQKCAETLPNPLGRQTCPQLRITALAGETGTYMYNTVRSTHGYSTHRLAWNPKEGIQATPKSLGKWDSDASAPTVLNHSPHCRSAFLLSSPLAYSFCKIFLRTDARSYTLDMHRLVRYGPCLHRGHVLLQLRLQDLVSAFLLQALILASSDIGQIIQPLLICTF